MLLYMQNTNNQEHSAILKLCCVIIIHAAFLLNVKLVTQLLKGSNVSLQKVQILQWLMVTSSTAAAGPPGEKCFVITQFTSHFSYNVQQELREAQMIYTLRNVLYIMLILATMSSFDPTGPGVISSSLPCDCLTLCNNDLLRMFSFLYISHPAPSDSVGLRCLIISDRNHLAFAYIEYAIA